ncbi:MAG TPA: hypothetical protein VF331_11800 [Polyangiales bacterium]
MSDKPKRASEYKSEQVELVRATCLYVATKLGDLMDELVVVGGLVGPRRVAEFIVGGRDEAIQADVVGFASQLLDKCAKAER